ncbi:ATP-grasp fold amidoligase family protein [Flavobacterium sp. GCM10023249]|uniref:ATP-grasp fold amidoligase family protein n=1 Tax=unclassified Flavobacterium TaxID=196869 RepID=UPI003619AB0C
MNFIKRKFFAVYTVILKMFGASDVAISKAKYYSKNLKFLDLDKPEEFMEKLQWLKLFYYKESYKNYVDKYEVRQFVKERIGEQYLNSIIGVFDEVDAINFDELPDQFVLKATHGSGFNVIVPDKTKLDSKKAKKELCGFMKRDYSKVNQEAIYKEIKPRILAENYLSQLEEKCIVDYKFFCFNGKAKYVWVKTFHDSKYRNCYYDLNWNKIKEENYRSNFLELDMKRPDNFEEMIWVAEKLSQDFIFMRVDLYSIQNKTYFGELTFFPWGGKQRITVEHFNKEFADLIQLPI